MKIVISLTDVNQLKYCPVCRTFRPAEDNYCPHHEEMVELLEVEVQP